MSDIAMTTATNMAEPAAAGAAQRPLAARLSVRLLWIALSIAALIILWQGAMIAFKPPAYLIPPPAGVFNAFIDKRAALLHHGSYTFSSALLGLTVSSVFAISLAVLFVSFRLLAQASMPLVIGFRSMPAAAIAPLITLMVGRGVGTNIVVVVLVSFFPILVNLMRGLQAPDRSTLELMHVYGATRWQQIRMLRAPFSLPYFFTGLRIAGANAILGAMLAEWLTGSRGLGFLILESSELREIELLWAAILSSVTVALLVFAATSAAERSVLHWREA